MFDFGETKNKAIELSKTIRCSECPCHSICGKNPCEETLEKWLKSQNKQVTS